MPEKFEFLGHTGMSSTEKKLLATADQFYLNISKVKHLQISEQQMFMSLFLLLIHFLSHLSGFYLWGQESTSAPSHVPAADKSEKVWGVEAGGVYRVHPTALSAPLLTV